jgi:hypothetical protein
MSAASVAGCAGSGCRGCALIVPGSKVVGWSGCISGIEVLGEQPLQPAVPMVVVLYWAGVNPVTVGTAGIVPATVFPRPNQPPSQLNHGRRQVVMGTRCACHRYVVHGCMVVVGQHVCGSVVLIGR